MLSLVLNTAFQRTVGGVAARHGSALRSSFQAAPVKGHTRCINKCASKTDYRDKPNPRSAYNIDTQRCLVVLDEDDVWPFFEDLSCTFGGQSTTHDHIARFRGFEMTPTIVI